MKNEFDQLNLLKIVRSPENKVSEKKITERFLLKSAEKKCQTNTNNNIKQSRKRATDLGFLVFSS